MTGLNRVRVLIRVQVRVSIRLMLWLWLWLHHLLALWLGSALDNNWVIDSVRIWFRLMPKFQ